MPAGHGRPLGLLLLLFLGLYTWSNASGAAEHAAAAHGGRFVAAQYAVDGGGPHRALASHSRAGPRRRPEPVNITATHKGDWQKLAWPEELSELGLLLQSSGIAVLKLRNLGKPEVGCCKLLPLVLMPADASTATA